MLSHLSPQAWSEAITYIATVMIEGGDAEEADVQKTQVNWQGRAALFMLIGGVWCGGTHTSRLEGREGEGGGAVCCSGGGGG